QNDVTLKMPAFEWVHVQLHQQKGMISLSPPTICNSAAYFKAKHLFFRFGWKDVKDDCDFILRRYFGGASLPDE
ncbi:hypothetical protein ACE19A_25940, partial [Escherichia coli]